MLILNSLTVSQTKALREFRSHHLRHLISRCGSFPPCLPRSTVAATCPENHVRRLTCGLIDVGLKRLPKLFATAIREALTRLIFMRSRGRVRKRKSLSLSSGHWAGKSYLRMHFCPRFLLAEDVPCASGKVEIFTLDGGEPVTQVDTGGMSRPDPGSGSVALANSQMCCS